MQNKFTREDALRLTIMPRHARRKYAKLLHVERLVGVQDVPIAVRHNAAPAKPILKFATDKKSSILDI